MIKIPKNIILSLAALILICGSCVKDDIEQIDNDLTFKPEYSIPIGSTEITVEEFITFTLEIRDTVLQELNDTTGISKEKMFYYDGKYFSSPQSLTWLDNITFDFSKLTNNFESIESLMLRLNIVNKIPAQCNLLAGFSNDNDTAFQADILTPNFTIEPAQLSGNNNTIPSEQYKNDFFFDKNSASKFIDKKTIYLNLRLTVENPTDEIIKYVSSQSLKVQFALRFSFESTSNEI